jgi:hypothetical protein
VPHLVRDRFLFDLPQKLSKLLVETIFRSLVMLVSCHHRHLHCYAWVRNRTIKPSDSARKWSGEALGPSCHVSGQPKPPAAANLHKPARPCRFRLGRASSGFTQLLQAFDMGLALLRGDARKPGAVRAALYPAIPLRPWLQDLSFGIPDTPAPAGAQIAEGLCLQVSNRTTIGDWAGRSTLKNRIRHELFPTGTLMFPRDRHRRQPEPIRSEAG